jgi:hypothetical protein
MSDRIEKAKQFAKDHALEIGIGVTYVAFAGAMVAIYSRSVRKSYQARIDFLDYKGELFATALDTTTDAILHKIANT